MQYQLRPAAALVSSLIQLKMVLPVGDDGDFFTQFRLIVGLSGGNGLNYVGGCETVNYVLPRPLLTTGAAVTGSGATTPWKSQT